MGGSIENETISFYEFDEAGKIVTSPSMYADFLKQENFIRITTADDKIMLLQNKNNVIDFFNHKTNLVSFLESEINEVKNEPIKNVIAKENLGVLSSSYTLLPFSQLNYYKDDKTRFGMAFKNGFHYFDEMGILEIKSKPYSDVKGFFTPHHTQSIDFNYTDEIGNFEKFIQRISTGIKHPLNDAPEIVAFNSMIGYLCHNYKKQQETPAIILSDFGANDENRNGGRGKTLITQAIAYVQKTMIKGANEFIPNYDFNYYDLDKSYNVYVLDDIEASFKLDSLYTQVTGGINVQKKGGKAEMIEFKDSPKFLITSNWLIRYDEKNASTNRRFYEYKVKPYYHKDYTPIQEFNKTMFEDWNDTEWNKFYSYIFRCVQSYLNGGLIKLAYDKTEDNFNASFGNDVRLSEMERIIDRIMNYNHQISFNVSEFLKIYNDFENNLRFEKLFSHVNAPKLIEVFMTKPIYKGWIRDKWTKRWIKQ